jgi:hypothetical protein
MSTAEQLGTIRVLDTNGKEVKLGDLWRERPAVLVFVRHFG